MDNRIRQLRIERGIKQKELAAFLEIAQSTLSYWESGTYDIDNASLMKLADYLEVSTDYILGRDEAPSDQPAEEFGGLDEVYFRFAKDIQDEGIDKEDLDLILGLCRMRLRRTKE